MKNAERRTQNAELRIQKLPHSHFSPFCVLHSSLLLHSHFCVLRSAFFTLRCFFTLTSLPSAFCIHRCFFTLTSAFCVLHSSLLLHSHFSHLCVLHSSLLLHSHFCVLRSSLPHPYPFTLPIIIPSMYCFCSARKSTRTGITVMTDPAIISSVSCACSPTRLASATGRVYF